jgi:hypothetical protein
MNRDTFWRLAEEALSQALTECGVESQELEETRQSMCWLALEDFENWGIMFVDGRGESGFFNVFVSNELSEEEIRQEFKQRVLSRYQNLNWRPSNPPL